MRIKTFLLLFAVAIMLVSCNSSPKRVYYDDNVDETSESSTDETMSVGDSEQVEESPSGSQSFAEAGDIVRIPFNQQGGVKLVDVSVNGFGFKMIFDTGCSSTLISVAEARYLYEKGYLTEEDFLGTTQSQIADGSIVEDMVVNLREVVIGGKILCTDVTATVSSNNNAPLLLGNEILDRVASYSVDNENQTINFNMK